jgi:GT2 family glycosyltransferase
MLRRIYGWGREVLPLRWRRAIRRRVPVERLFGIRREPAAPHLPPADRERIPGRPDIVWLPLVEWEFRRQRPQQLASALARADGRVFYADFRANEIRAVEPGVLLFPMRGARAEDVPERPLAGGPLAQAESCTAAVAEAFCLREAVVVCDAPYWRPLAERLRARFGWKIVYDCLDDHAGFSDTRASFVEAEESRLASGADLVLATSEALARKMSAHSSRVLLLRNGADADAFAGFDPSPAPRRPRVGYYGAVADWFDFELFFDVARRHPEWDFPVVGKVESEGRTRGAPGNVLWMGERPYSEIPAFVAGLDAGVIPFKVEPLTVATDPVKVYEMLAAGLPVVATPLPELSRLERAGLVRLAGDPAGFEESVAAALAQSDPEARERRRAFGRDNRWDSRAGVLRAAMRALFPKVSVVVVTFDNLEYNRACLESLRRSTEWPNLEFLFVDNGSRDGTAEWLEREAQARPGEMKVIRNAGNLGFAAAVNQGVSACTGEYVCLLNNDTVVTPGWLSALVGHLERDPGVAMVGPSTNEIANAARIPVGYEDLAGLPDWARRFVSAHRDESIEMPMLAMFCVLYQRSLAGKIGPLDERFGIGMFEDDDYCRRIRAAGQRLVCARDAFVHHRGRASFEKLGEPEYLRVYRENERLYREKWGDPKLPARLAQATGVIVFPPSIGWNVTLVQRPHALARAFARRGRPVVFDCTGSSVDGFEGFQEVEKDLFLFRGPAEMLHQLKRPVRWCFAYNVEPGTPGRVVYDIIDALSVFPYPGKVLAANHERALLEAEMVFAVSRPLLAQARLRRPDAKYLPNAVDPSRFGSAPRKSGARPVAGYVGALARWLDTELLAEVARLAPDWELRLVGAELDGTVRASALGKRPNVRFPGPCPHEDVPEILSGFDVALLPFRAGPETEAVSPIKLYEYFAAGLPVVSTPMPEAEAFPEVAIAKTAAEFVKALEAARLRRGDPAFVERLRALAQKNTWDARAAQALAAIDPAGA